MARTELQRSGLLTIDPQTGRVNYRQLFEKAIELLKRDDERFLHIAHRLDAIIDASRRNRVSYRQETQIQLEEIADYSRVMAAQLPKYRQSNSAEESDPNGFTGC